MQTKFSIEIEKYAEPERNLVVNFIKTNTTLASPTFSRDELAELAKTIIDFLSKTEQS